MNLKVAASQECPQSRVTSRVSWQSGQEAQKKKKLTVKS
jgi:hypothetical protein